MDYRDVLPALNPPSKSIVDAPDRNNDDDDDDIIILDPPDVLQDDVRCLLHRLVTRVSEAEEAAAAAPKAKLRQINVEERNDEEDSSNKKVRFHSLFVSETVDQPNRSEGPFAQFLINLGLDLCLENYPNETSHSLNVEQKSVLEQFNRPFHYPSPYSCEFCSFQTESRYVLDQHHLTPHVMNDQRFRYAKYRCTFCSFQTFRLSQLRRHAQRKHQVTLLHEPADRRYSCCFCTFDTDDKIAFRKHQNRCQIEQERVRLANNLLAPTEEKTPTISTRKAPVTLPMAKKKPDAPPTTTTCPVDPLLQLHSIDEPIIIESDHDSLPPSVASSPSPSPSSSDPEVILSSDKESSSISDHDQTDDDDDKIQSTRVNKPNAVSTAMTIRSRPVAPATIVPPINPLTSLSKLLLLNGAPTVAIVSPIMPPKPALVPIQPKPISNCDNYQMCSTCGCYVFKADFLKHFNEKHLSHSIAPLPILNNATNNVDPTAPKSTTEPPQQILLVSTATLHQSSFVLSMIKCPWCDTNVEHIDVFTGHLMRYHRMTLSAAKVVVAEQMKLQSSNTSQLSILFRKEIEQIQNEFPDKSYWKVMQPKIYLNRMSHISCFVCHDNIDDVENHFLSSHQIPLMTMNMMKQCCLCGFHCKKKDASLFEHQLRVHAGICYSLVLKQFIRFEPAPPAISTPSPSTSSRPVTLSTYTEKKFGCRKCDTNRRLFTFDELVEHLRSHHHLNVKLHRRCIFCSKTFPKGKEYNEHCLEHLHDENPSIPLRRYVVR